MGLRSKKPRLESAHKDTADDQMMVILDPSGSQGSHSKDKKHTRDGIFGTDDPSQHRDDGPEQDERDLVEGENIVILPPDHIQIIFKASSVGVG